MKQMNNSIFKVFIMVMAVLSTALPSFATMTNTHSIKFLATKFAIAMLGVFLFSFLLYVGLTIYNKYFVDEQIKNFNMKKDSLRTPRDIDEAIMMFISKNRMM